ncbi:hypothetical protein EYF80_060743 [Liparis tanakae]|uniref:Secreted protein n=1 Tax=Liparis tanakae TaxID=230148 RepID=A0A4Z2EJX4_9TELE|nr:hypothetical protein EYF80_060743 [Liparis tanakae]
MSALFLKRHFLLLCWRWLRDHLDHPAPHPAGSSTVTHHRRFRLSLLCWRHQDQVLLSLRPHDPNPPQAAAVSRWLAGGLLVFTS